MPLIVALGLVGAAWLVRRRRIVPLLGLIALTGGIAAFLVVLAARGTYVSMRYLAGFDIGVAVMAAFGVVALVEAAVARNGPRLGPLSRSRPRAVAAAVVVLALIVVDTWPPPSVNVAVRRSAAETRRQAEHAERVEPILRCALASIPHGVPWPPPRDVLGPIPPDELVLIVPGLLRPRFARDLGVPLNAIGGSAVASLEPSGSFLPWGTIIYHDSSADRPHDEFAILEFDRPTVVSGLMLTPLLADSGDGIWVIWIGRAGGLPAPASCKAGSAG